MQYRCPIEGAAVFQSKSAMAEAIALLLVLALGDLRRGKA